VKLTTHLHLVPSSRMRGAIPPLSNMPSWRGALLKHRDNFTFTFTFTFSGVKWISEQVIMNTTVHVVRTVSYIVWTGGSRMQPTQTNNSLIWALMSLIDLSFTCR
jgi:hypothetical protein